MKFSIFSEMLLWTVILCKNYAYAVSKTLSSFDKHIQKYAVSQTKSKEQPLHPVLCHLKSPSIHRPTSSCVRPNVHYMKFRTS
jgi:hypothetical protein